MANPCDDFESNECQAALQELSQYLDGVLTVERRTVIKTHIDLCSHCLDTYSFEIELRQVISRRCCDEVPESLRRRIADAIRDDLQGQ